jgi:hypothetical protein
MNSIETQVLELIGESTSSPDVFTEAAIAPIRDSVNAAIAELCMVTGSAVRTYHLPLYADRHFYRMGWGVDEFAYIVECWDRAAKLRLRQTDLITLSKTDPWFLKGNGDPNRYFQVGQKYVGFDRAPSTSGKVLELLCVVIPKAYTDDSMPVKVRSLFQRAAVFYALSEYYASRGDAARATENHAKYIETAGIMGLTPQQPERTFTMQTAGAPSGNIQ